MSTIMDGPYDEIKTQRHFGFELWLFISSTFTGFVKFFYTLMHIPVNIFKIGLVGVSCDKSVVDIRWCVPGHVIVRNVGDRHHCPNEEEICEGLMQHLLHVL